MSTAYVWCSLPALPVGSRLNEEVISWAMLGRNEVAENIAGTAQSMLVQWNVPLPIQAAFSDRSSGSSFDCLFRPTSS